MASAPPPPSASPILGRLAGCEGALAGVVEGISVFGELETVDWASAEELDAQNARMSIASAARHLPEAGLAN